MADNLGKDFESQFKSDFLKTFPDGTVDRIYDTMSKFKCVTNICDFIGYTYPNIFYLECKSHKGPYFSIMTEDKKTKELKPFRQYKKLAEKIGIKGVRTGIVLWMIDYNRVMYFPIATIRRMIEDGKRSINMNTLEKEDYKYYDIPSIKKKTLMTSDYSILLTTLEGE